jgi:hypothetical protein
MLICSVCVKQESRAFFGSVVMQVYRMIIDKNQVSFTFKHIRKIMDYETKDKSPILILSRVLEALSDFGVLKMVNKTPGNRKFTLEPRFKK